MSYIPQPILSLPFAVSKSFAGHPAYSFARASIGSYFDSGGILRYARSGVPRIDYDPLTGICKGMRIESAMTYLGKYSKQFDNASWSKYGASVVPNQILYLDGDMQADKLVESATYENNHSIYQTFSISAAQPVWMEFIVSSAGRSRCVIQLYSTTLSGYKVSINLSDMSSSLIMLGSGASDPKYGVEKLSGGRYSLWLSCIMSATDITATAQFVILNDSNNVTYTGDGVSGFYLYEGCMGMGSFPPSSLPTGFESSSATANSISKGVKVFNINNDSTKPGQSIPAGASLYAWQASNSKNNLTGSVTSHSGTTLTVNITSVGGTGTGITDWTIQAGASVTRAGDVITTDLTLLRDGSGSAVWTGTGGTLVMQAWTAAGKPTGTAVQVLAQIDDGTISNRVRVYRNATGNIKCSVDAGGVNQVDLDLGVVADSTECKVAFSFATSAFYASINGGNTVSSTSGTMPTGLVTRRHGCDSAGASQWGGYLKLDQTYNRPIAASYLSVLSTL